MNSVAPIASNRVYVREKCFNCSNFICMERSQWRLESQRSLFFPVFVCFVLLLLLLLLFINYNSFPLACNFTLFALLTLYTSRDFYIYRLFRNSLVKFPFFQQRHLMSALSGCFFFLFPYCPDLFGNERTKLKAKDQGCTSTTQIDDATATTDLNDIFYWYFLLVPAKCTKFRKVSSIERFQQEGGA